MPTRPDLSEKLGADYEATVQQMFDAALEWLALYGAEGLSFILPPEDMMFIGELRGPVIEALAPAGVSREFLEWLDHATNNKATAFQACFVVRHMKLPIDPRSESHWAGILAKQGKPSN